MDHTAKATVLNGDVNVAGNVSSMVEVELEAMRKHDFSWHPCKVSLCSTGVGLVIEYLKNGSNEIIVDKEEAVKRIRIRSIPLEDVGCTSIQQGDHVLAKKRVRRDTLLLDATVDKALNSKKAHPRCTFVVKWTYGQAEGETATVPCNAMWKVSSKGINSHPTVIAFFNISRSSSSFSIPPIPSVGEEMKREFDANEHGDQIEKISNSADNLKIRSSEKEQSWQDGTLGVTGNGLTRMPWFTESNDPHKKEFIEVKPVPNPIAARAALASMLFKLNNNSEVSLVQQEAEEFKTSKTTNGTTPFNISAVNNFSKAHDYSLHTKLGKQKQATLMKELFPNGNTAKEEAQEMKKEPSRQSRYKEDILIPSNGTRRLTRSATSELKDKQAAEASELDGKQVAVPKIIARPKNDMPAGKDIVVHRLGVEKNVSSGRIKSNKDENPKAVTSIGLKDGKVTGSIGTPKLGDDGTCSTLSRQGTKRKSVTLKKQEPRSSPRLRLLAQTNSQKKS